MSVPERRNINEDYLLRVSRGQVDGAFLVHKYGHNTQINSSSATYPEDVWSYGGLWNEWLAAGETVNIAGNAGDAGLPIEVQGLDGSGNLQTETATHPGATPTALANQYSIIFRAKNRGTSQLVGAVTFTGTTSATVGAEIPGPDVSGLTPVYYDQTMMAIYRVPAGYDAYVIDWWNFKNRGSLSAGVNVNLQVKNSGEVWRVIKNLGIAANDSGRQIKMHWEKLSPLTTIRSQVEYVSANNTEVDSGFTLLLESQ